MSILVRLSHILSVQFLFLKVLKRGELFYGLAVCFPRSEKPRSVEAFRLDNKLVRSTHRAGYSAKRPEPEEAIPAHRVPLSEAT